MLELVAGPVIRVVTEQMKRIYQRASQRLANLVTRTEAALMILSSSRNKLPLPLVLLVIRSDGQLLTLKLSLALKQRDSLELFGSGEFREVHYALTIVSTFHHR